MKILIWNFQDLFLRVREHHSWHQEWPCPPCLLSGTLNILQVPPFLTLPLLDTLLIEISTQNFQGIFLGVKKNIIHDVRNDPVIHVSGKEPSTSSKYPPSWSPPPDTLPIEISTWDFQSMFLRVIEHHSWHQEWPCQPCLRAGTLNVCQVPPFLTPPSWHTSNWDINTKFSGYIPWGKKMIHDIRNDYVLHESVQEPSMSSKYPILDPPPFLTHFWLRYQHKLFRVSSLG